jgi:hypothetical protein
MGAIGDNGSEGHTFLDISRGLNVLGLLGLGFLCFVLAKRDRALKVGPRGRSPVGPLVLGGIGIWFFTVQLYAGFSWVVTTSHFTSVWHLCNVIRSVGLVSLGGALVLTALYRAGPAVRLFAAAGALLLLALMNVVYAYSTSLNALITSASLLSVGWFGLAIIFFVSPLLTRRSRRVANGDQRIARA